MNSQGAIYQVEYNLDWSERIDIITLIGYSAFIVLTHTAGNVCLASSMKPWINGI